MPSVTDVQQQQQSSTATHGKATPPPQQTSAAAATTAAAGDADPLTQAILLLDKKQRNLGKRKEKLETYQQEAKTGKELHKDQTEALAKYPEVLGQIECVKELSEQLKKLQVETARNQKRLSKQAADEKRQLVSQRLREYARLRYLLDHRPATLKPEDVKLLDELAAVITPTENSLASISRSIDTVLGIYQANSSSAPIKHLPGRSAQEVREALEQLLQSSEPQPTPTPTPTPAPTVSAPEPVQVKAPEETNDVQPTSDDDTSNKPTQLSEYPFQLDTRTQDISVEQIIQNSQFLSNDSPTPSQDNDNEQALDQNQYLQPFTVVNSNQQTSPAAAAVEHQHAGNAAHPVDTHDQHAEGQWQQPRGNAQRGGQYTEGNGSRSFHRGRPHQYNQSYRGSRGGGYENSYGSGGGQRPYHENNRGRGGPNPYHRGNRGGNFRGGNRGYYNNSNNGEGYHNAGQQQQVRSAPPSSTQHQ